MNATEKLGIMIYIVVMTVCIVVSVTIYVKAKKTPVLYSLMACHTLIYLWLFLCIIGVMANDLQEVLFLNRIGLFPISFLGETDI